MRLPEQHDPKAREEWMRLLDGEKDLYAAIVLQALQDVRIYRDYSHKVYRHYGSRARAWFASDVLSPFSFRHCCQVLGYDTEEIRKKVNEHPPVNVPAVISMAKSQLNLFAEAV